MQIFCKCKRFFANAQTKMRFFSDFFQIHGRELQKVRFFNIWVICSLILRKQGKSIGSTRWSTWLNALGQLKEQLL